MKILLIRSKSICYNSTWLFIQELESEFIELGCEADICEDISLLSGSFSYNQYDAIIDFNSTLPLKMSPELIKVPFYNFILDHPLYHHEALRAPLLDYNVICLDTNHANYIRTWYPNINKIIMHPLSSVKSPLDIPWMNRQYGLSFMGTYTDSSKVMNIIEENGGDYARNVKHFVEYLTSNPDSTLESAFLDTCKDPEPELFTLAMHTLFPADMYITALFREHLIKTILDFNVDINVWGNNWQNSPFINNPYFHMHGEVDYSSTSDICANSRFVLNINPWFKAGVHDRVISSMINGAIALTDSSAYIDSHFTNKKDIVLYSLTDLGQCPDNYINLSNNTANCISIAANGQTLATDCYSFHKLALDLLCQL